MTTQRRAGVDPRTRRTLAKLEEALQTLLREQALGDITVAELCRAAGIHRTTFYKHYSSAGQFATLTLSGWIDDLSVGGDDEVPGDLAEMAGIYERALCTMLEHVAEHRLIYRRMLAPDGDFAFQRVLVELLSERAAQAHERFAARGRTIPIDPFTAAAMVGGACAAALAVWAVADDTDAAARSEEIRAALPAWWQPA